MKFTQVMLLELITFEAMTLLARILSKDGRTRSCQMSNLLGIAQLNLKDLACTEHQVRIAKSNLLTTLNTYLLLNLNFIHGDVIILLLFRLCVPCLGKQYCVIFV